MKASNAVVGGKVQIKRACRGHSNEIIAKGLVCTVSRVMGETYELRLKHPDIEYGFAWVNASDCRKYLEPAAEVVEDTPLFDVPHDITEGTLLRCIRSFTSRHDDKFTAGTVYTVSRNDVVYADELKLTHPTLGGGYGFGKPADFCLVHPTPLEKAPVLLSHNYQVGDKVLVGTEGAGYGLVQKEYANLVCTVSEVPHGVDYISIKHPDVMSDMEYTTKLQYITPYTGEPIKPVQLTCANVQVGDWLVYNDGDCLEKGVPYQVVTVCAVDSICVANHSSSCEVWQVSYATRTRYFNKVLREV